MKNSAIIVAGGMGTRMNAGIPKQFLLLKGKPLLFYSLEAFTRAIPGIFIVLALPGGQFSAWEKLCAQHSFTLPHQLVAGGETRFHSVQNALSAIGDDGLTGVHDGARPLISEELIQRAFQTAAHLGNCIPVIPFSESVRILTNLTLKREGASPVDRSLLRVVQTPQVFQTATIKNAYGQAFRELFTDDATVAESVGETINLIDGDPANIKITHPLDFALAEALIGARE
ncbi:MAG: 2-C-methyl-D-erythritol 4-phosphate cytidylyltransferase [Bacteroidetes bacterium]|nr:2-C-methyl-D-erythritol 4-phosphate cytidylyltransferase [Bacteroidota bacterium]